MLAKPAAILEMQYHFLVLQNEETAAVDEPTNDVDDLNEDELAAIQSAAELAAKYG